MGQKPGNSDHSNTKILIEYALVFVFSMLMVAALVAIVYKTGLLTEVNQFSKLLDVGDDTLGKKGRSH